MIPIIIPEFGATSSKENYTALLIEFEFSLEHFFLGKLLPNN